MNKYEYEKLEIGHEEKFTFELNEEKMKKFLEISGDVNPLHNDIEFARKKGYPEKVVYGLLTSSALSTLAGVYLPGEKSLIHSINVNFIKPVFISQSPLQVIGKVIDKNDLFSVITVKFQIKDKSNEKVCRGKMQIGFLH